MNTGLVQGVRPLLHRLLNIMGGFVPLTNSYSTGAIAAIQEHIVGQKQPRPSDWESIYEASERVVFWGSDPVRTDDVDWFTPLHKSRAGALRLAELKHIKTYSINPIISDTALAIGSENIRPLPGTDTAMIVAMIHVLLTENLADWDFLDRYTTGAREFTDYVLGHTDGIAKTPEWAAEIAGVPAVTIRELAVDLATHRSMIIMGWGPQRQHNGEQAPWLGWTLAAFLGQIGLPGGGIGTSYHYSSAGAPPSGGPELFGIPTDPTGAQRNRILGGVKPLPVASITEVLEAPGKTVDFNGARITYPDVHLMFWAGGNPFAHHPDTGRLARAFKKPDVVICAEVNWTATARHADIVLPACTNFEMSDITRIGSNTNDGIVFTEAVIAPQGEAKSNYEIFSLLAAKLGVAERFTGGRTAEQWREALYSNACEDALSRGKPLPSYEEAKALGLLLFTPDAPEDGKPFVSMAKFRQDPVGHRLWTKSGKIEIASETIRNFHYGELTAYPRYMPPEDGAGKTTEAYPFVLLTGKSPRRLHSQLDSSLTEKYGAEPCRINTEDAKRLGISAGDTVLVSSARGKTLLAAEPTDRIRPGVVAVDNGSWYNPKTDPVHGLIDAHGGANTLTLDVPTSRIARGNVVSSATVSVVKYTGPFSPADPLTLPEGITG